MSHLGAGRGLATSLGVLLPITMAAGIISVRIGAGARARFMRLPIMARHSSDSSAADSALELGSDSVGAEVMAGSRSVGESRSVHGIAAVRVTGIT